MPACLVGLRSSLDLPLDEAVHTLRSEGAHVVLVAHGRMAPPRLRPDVGAVLEFLQNTRTAECQLSVPLPSSIEGKQTQAHESWVLQAI